MQFPRNKNENELQKAKLIKPKVAMHALWIGQQVVKLPAAVAKTNLWSVFYGNSRNCIFHRKSSLFHTQRFIRLRMLGVGRWKGIEISWKIFSVVKWKIDFSTLICKGTFLDSLSNQFSSHFLSQIGISDMRC